MNLSIFKYDQLSSNSVEKSLFDMVARTQLGAIFLMIVYYLIFYYQVFQNHKSNFYVCFGLLFLVTINRFVQTKYSRQIFNLKNGIAKWRFNFGLNSVVIMLVWTYSVGFNLIHEGLTLHSYFLLTVTVAIGGISAPAFAFDFLTNIVCQVLLLLPLAILAFPLGIEGKTLSLCMFIFMAYTIYIGYDLQRTNISELVNFEKTISQKNQLTQLNSNLLEANDIMAAIFNSVDVAFLVFDLEGFCLNSPGDIAKKIFQTDLDGQHVSDLLGNKEYTKSQVKSWFELIKLQPNNFRNIVNIGPEKLIDDGRALNLNFYPLKSENGTLKSVILIARDISRETADSKKIKQTETESKLILRIYNQKAEFKSFLEAFRTFISNYKTSEIDVDSFALDLHTWKSLARINAAEDIAIQIHNSELALKSIQQKNTHKDKIEILPIVQDLEVCFEKWLVQNQDLFSDMDLFNKDNSQKINTNDISRIEKILQTETQGFTANKIMSFFKFDNLEQVFASLEGQIYSQARALQKNVKYRVIPPNQPIFIEREIYNNFFQSLVHLFNNALDHGIEPSEIRIKNGKDETGLIQVSFQTEQSNEIVKIRINDDGGGIDREKLKFKLRQVGYDIRAIGNDQDLIEKIFEPKITTKTEVNEFSGLGVGMAAVKAKVKEIGGEITIVKSDTSGTEYEIKAPLVVSSTKLKKSLAS